jgi:hypothetical protein
MVTYLLETALPSLQFKQDIQFITALIAAHEKFGIMNKLYEKLFQYLEASIYEDHLKLLPRGWMIFKNHVFGGIAEQFAGILCELIRSERLGAFIDKDNVIGNCVSMFAQMDALPPATARPYKNSFEIKLLEDYR